MSHFKVIPAIDLIDGKCVRLIQGDYSQKTIYNTDPKTVANQFLDAGFDFVHVVDLDGAKAGKPMNLSTVEKIASTGITIELGGGLRNESHLKQAVNAGAKDLILGTKLLDQGPVITEWTKLFPGRLVAGIDAKNGLVAVHGWGKTSSITAVELVRKIESLGFSRVIYTDIQRDGMLSGPNIEQLKSIAEITKLPVIASGGVSSFEDIENIKSLVDLGVEGVIVGKAIYEGKLTLQELIQC
ncbi:MAG: 1-(5-phosphoribosyl)-5-[(5-phosphoribosylamino)methylideneamino]imidazole-4-carboxamide isomerase [Candidatus Marinimicrobia bacterium]|nr:1-(5-phosphoribosyl)-5-[(5-phosphoribosylamino)methylideneamino]imidazole-4-carboxamide isomerase [Candidatus Neomarinimicrobiota bacterium]MCH7762464.1 1-(5-phosphoribosyl)-5-[(5-phosphoribosylamino)methylideneamino]imidazole-4-carboxamide isomerase [Candidatus Neomarinimicrobiota bacterium]